MAISGRKLVSLVVVAVGLTLVLLVSSQRDAAAQGLVEHELVSGLVKKADGLYAAVSVVNGSTATRTFTLEVRLSSGQVMAKKIRPLRPGQATTLEFQDYTGAMPGNATSIYGRIVVRSTESEGAMYRSTLEVYDPRSGRTQFALAFAS